MTHYKNFAVVGAGGVGSLIVDELLKLKSAGKINSVLIAGRSDSYVSADHPSWVAQGVKFTTVDYENPTTLQSALQDIDVLISTIGSSAILTQIPLAEAAKAAGVKLFLPSEFGIPSNNPTGAILHKVQVREKLKEIDLPYTAIYNGIWVDAAFIPVFGWDLVKGTVNIAGSGNSPITFTDRDDTVRFLIHIITEVDPSLVEWKSFHLEGERTTLNDIVTQYQTKTGKKLDVSYTPASVLHENVEKNPTDLASILRLNWEEGRGVVGEPQDVWPEWNPKKALEVLLTSLPL